MDYNSQNPIPAGSFVGGRPTISLCMMIKNEEKRLADALESARLWVDEIIAVDTGSTDRSVEIAESFGAKVYHHPWENSFSKHRNQSIEYATSDWILILDADEKLDPETAPLLRQLVYAPPTVNCVLFELYNDVQAGGRTFLMHPRLFRNRVGFHYEGKVHNRPIISGGITKSSVRLFHYGYNEDQATMEAKHQRRVEMMRKWVREEPDNFHAYSYLAHTLQAQAATGADAVEAALTGIDLLNQSGETNKTNFYPHAYYPLLNSLAALGRDEELVRYAKECIDLVPLYPDAFFFLVWYYYKVQNWEETRNAARDFIKLQDECRDYPERFIFFENLTLNQLNNVLFRWVVSDAHLGFFEELKELFQRMLGEADAELACKLTVQTLLQEYSFLSKDLAAIAKEHDATWPWPIVLLNLAEEKAKEEEARNLQQSGMAALDQGQTQEAAQLLKQAVGMRNDPQAMFSLAMALEDEGQSEEAYGWMMGSLNLHPGNALAWKKIADRQFAAGDYAGAAACYRRYFIQSRDESVAGRLTMCKRRVEQSGIISVSQKPLKLVVFLMSGMTPEMLRQPAPHFLIGTAWGEFMPSLCSYTGDPAWATLFTGHQPLDHGLHYSSAFGLNATLQESPLKSLWELLPPDLRVGFMTAPLVWPPLEVPGWNVAGYPAGILLPSNVYPSQLAAQVLATGFRSDYLLNAFDEQVLGNNLTDVRQEAFMYQIERNKIIAALALPAVDVLVIGFNALEYVQQTHGLAHYATFSAYQQAYAWIDGMLAAMKPEGYAILSQHYYNQYSNFSIPGGFYCLSWLKGENAQADPLAIAPEIMTFLGADSARLGTVR